MRGSIFEAFLDGSARRFYGAHFADPQARREAVVRAQRPLEAAVADALCMQNAAYAPSRARDRHLQALRTGASAVVTGQQVGLLLGPLFNLYKAATAIRAARELGEESGRPVVPVFWLQTEDHDLPEVSEIHVPSRSAATPRTLALPASPNERISLAHCVLPEGIGGCLIELRRELEGLPHAASHLAMLERHYRAGAPWAAAFAGVLAELFAGEGLVILDARDARFGDAARRVHGHALAAAREIADALLERSRELEAAGFAAAVHVRAGAPLSFYHPHGPLGPRYRLEPVAAADASADARGGAGAGGGAGPDRYAEVGGPGMHDAADLVAALERDSLSFSTSALQRPILQDVLLPTAGYVAGPGEVAYFAQLAPLYEAYGMTMPVVVPRARACLLEQRTLRLLHRLGLSARDAARSEDEMLAATAPGGDAVNPAHGLLRAFEHELAIRREAIEAEGAGVPEALAKTQASVERAIAKLGHKIEHARLHRDCTRIEEIARLKASLQPCGEPQERVFGFSYFAARYGARDVIARVLAEVRPFDATPLEIELSGATSAAESPSATTSGTGIETAKGTE